MPDFHVDYGNYHGGSSCCLHNKRYPEDFPVEGPFGDVDYGPWSSGDGPCMCDCLKNDLPKQYGECCDYQALGVPPFSNSNGGLHAAIEKCEAKCRTRLKRPWWTNDLWLPGWDNIPEPYGDGSGTCDDVPKKDDKTCRV